MYNNSLISPNTTTTPDYASIFGGMTAGLIIFFVFLGLLVLALAIFMIIAQCKIYTKAGEKWWKAFIPVYSTWVETKITGLAWWWCPIFLGVSALSGIKEFSYVPGFAVLIIAFNYSYNLAKKFGKSNGFAVLYTLLPIVGIPMLAFGSAKYNAKADTDKNGIFAVEKDLVK
ncbi:MAG: hypothetical protein IJ097_01700 [Bacilli bacterium]|nr:hypothetical protein [Bacilli bacterium]